MLTAGRPPTNHTCLHGLAKEIAPVGPKIEDRKNLLFLKKKKQKDF